MSRVVAIVVGLVAVIAITVPLLRTTEDSYRVDADFDTASGLVAGQVVKVAGAPVGSVDSVELTPEFKARVEMTVDERFAPFHEDASCSILPESLISEKYVECDPGDPGQPALAGAEGGTPIVTVEHNAVPIALQDMIEVFAVPAADRLRVVFNELGIATAGRGEDINAILRRANPALEQANRVLATVNAQKREVVQAVVDTDKVIAELADREQQVRGFVDRGAAVVAETAAHREALGEAVRRLPALLAAAPPSLRALRDFTVAAEPLLGDLRAAAPALSALLDTVPDFVSVARPAVQELGGAASKGIAAVRSARPLVAKLRKFAEAAGPAALLLDALLVDLRETGGLEGLLSFVYAGATLPATYDELGHILGLQFVNTPCLATPDAPECNANYNSGANATSTRERSGVRASDDRSAPSPGAPGAPAPAPAPGSGPSKPPAGPLDGLKGLDDLLDLPKGALDDLLGGKKKGSGGGGKGPGGAGSTPGSGAIEDLLDFLLG